MKIFDTALAATIVTSLYAPVAGAQEYVDSYKISDWSKEAVTELSVKGCFVGYTNNEFKPEWSISREELAVVLYKCLQAQEVAYKADFDKVMALVDANYAELKAAIDELAKENQQLVAITNKLNEDRPHSLGLSVIYLVDDQSDLTGVSLDAKFRVVKLTDKLSIAIRPSINTASELSAAATLDYQVTPKLSLYAGGGATYRFDEEGDGFITRGLKAGDEITATVNAGAEYNFSKTTGAYLGTVVPLHDNADPIVLGGVKLNF